MSDGPYEDDAAVQTEHHLWRRIPPQHFVPDETTKTIRCSSAAFSDTGGSPMSVVWGEMVLAGGRVREHILVRHDGFGLASITAGLARENQQIVSPDPLPDEPAHYLVVGKKTRSVSRKFSKSAHWEVPPPISYDELVASKQGTNPPSSPAKPKSGRGALATIGRAVSAMLRGLRGIWTR